MKHKLLLMTLLLSSMITMSQTLDETREWIISKLTKPGVLLSTESKQSTSGFEVYKENIEMMNIKDCKITNQYLEIDIIEHFIWKDVSGNSRAIKTTYYKIDLSKLDTSFYYMKNYGYYDDCLTTKGNYIERRITYNHYKNFKKYTSSGDFD